MTINNTYRDYVLELIEPLGKVQARRFFGGIGLSLDDVQFGMIMGSSLYFVVDDSTRKRYQQAGSTAFSYATKKGMIQVKKYFELPEAVLTEPELLKKWLAESLRVAKHSAQPRNASIAGTPPAKKSKPAHAVKSKRAAKAIDH